MVISYQEHILESGTYWTAWGDGFMRPVLAEGGTKQEARQNFYQVCSEQYHQMEALSAQPMRNPL